MSKDKEFDRYDTSYLKDIKYNTKEITVGTYNDIKKAFAFLDLDHSGKVDTQELRKALDDVRDEIKEVYPDFDPEEAIGMILDQVDANGDGKIDLKEFMNVMVQEPINDLTKRENTDRLYAEFAPNGKLDKAALQKVSKDIVVNDDKEMIEKMMFYADTNDDGIVDEDEFYNILNPDPEEIMKRAKLWRDAHSEKAEKSSKPTKKRK